MPPERTATWSSSTSAPAEWTRGVQAEAELVGAQGTPGGGPGKAWPEREWRMTKDIPDGGDRSQGARWMEVAPRDDGLQCLALYLIHVLLQACSVERTGPIMPRRKRSKRGKSLPNVTAGGAAGLGAWSLRAPALGGQGLRLGDASESSSPCRGSVTPTNHVFCPVPISPTAPFLFLS